MCHRDVHSLFWGSRGYKFDIAQGQCPGVTGSDYGFQSSVIFKDLKKENYFKWINANLFNATNTDTL